MRTFAKGKGVIFISHKFKFSISDKSYATLKEIALKKGVPMSNLVRLLINSYLKKYKESVK